MANFPALISRSPGVRCDSPALRGEQFCYFHQRVAPRRPHAAAGPPPPHRSHRGRRVHPDRRSWKSSTPSCATPSTSSAPTLILRALHIAVKNARRVKFDIHAGDTVKEIPEYASVGADAFVRPSGEAAVQLPTEADRPAEDELPRTASIAPARTLSAREQRNLQKLRQEQAHQADIRARLTRVAETLSPRPENVGTAAPGCSSGPAGRSPATTHVGTDAFVRTGGPAVPVRSSATTANAQQKKPPVGANEPTRTNRKHATAKAPKG